ncbi:MAG: ArsC family transcriptional regulator [Ignavibacteriae bacterium]|nr:MAG: ArsC family transcriptional regulator [Ignavibacteriota bacterium]
MNIQILGTKKCNNTKKAQRFFKERNIQIHFRDLTEKSLSSGELENITRKIELDDLIDKDSKQYKKRGLQFMVFNAEEEILEDPLIIKTPIVRNGKESTIGYVPDVWKSWF